MLIKQDDIFQRKLLTRERYIGLPKLRKITRGSILITPNLRGTRIDKMMVRPRHSFCQPLEEAAGTLLRISFQIR